MTTELGLRHIERMRMLLERFREGSQSLGGLVSDCNALIGLLSSEEADPGWLDDLQAEVNRLELVYASVVNSDGNPTTPNDNDEVADACLQLRLMLVEY